MRRRAGAATVVIFTLFAAACGDATAPEVFTLEVRVHVLESTFAPLNANLSDGEVASLFDEVNAIWSQAGIQWAVGDIVREPARNAETYEAILAGGVLPTTQTLSTILPLDNLTNGAWDVFFVGTLGGLAGGIYMPGIPAVLGAEFDPTGNRDLTQSGPRILAHELGHSLGMGHVPCTSAGNLMAPNCPRGVRTRLTAEQITATRVQGERDRPVTLF